MLGITWKQIVLINGVPCRIYAHRYTHGTNGGGRYVQLHVGKWMRAVKVVILALFTPDGTKIYVVPVRHLQNVPVILLPFRGNYGTSKYKKPKRDWTRYEDAWQFIKR